MSQFERPDGDITKGNFTTDTGSTTNEFSRINEVVADDTTFIKSAALASGGTDTFVCSLSDAINPLSTAGHIVRYRYQKDAAGGVTVNLTVELRQAYVSEVVQGTLIHAEAIANIPNGFVTGSFTLTAPEATLITDYTALFLRFAVAAV